MLLGGGEGQLRGNSAFLGSEIQNQAGLEGAEGGRPILTRALLFPGFCEEAPGFFSPIFPNQSFPYLYLDGRAFLGDQPSQFS